MVGAEVGVGDESGEDEHVGVADDPHREDQGHPDRALAVDRNRLRGIEDERPAAPQEGEREQRRHGVSDRHAGDRPVDRRAGDQQRHDRGEGEERSRRLGGDVGVGAALDPDRDRRDPEDRSRRPGERRVDDQGRVGSVAEQEVGERLGERRRERDPDRRDPGDRDQPGAEAAARVARELLVVLVVVIVVVAAEGPLQRPLLARQREQQREQARVEHEQSIRCREKNWRASSRSTAMRRMCRGFRKNRKIAGRGR